MFNYISGNGDEWWIGDNLFNDL